MAQNVQKHIDEVLKKKGYDEDFDFYGFAATIFIDTNSIEDAWETIIDILDKTPDEFQQNFWDSYLNELSDLK